MYSRHNVCSVSHRSRGDTVNCGKPDNPAIEVSAIAFSLNASCSGQAAKPHTKTVQCQRRLRYDPMNRTVPVPRSSMFLRRQRMAQQAAPKACQAVEGRALLLDTPASAQALDPFAPPLHPSHSPYVRAPPSLTQACALTPTAGGCVRPPTIVAA